jgi:hypothetical protein
VAFFIVRYKATLLREPAFTKSVVGVSCPRPKKIPAFNLLVAWGFFISPKLPNQALKIRKPLRVNDFLSMAYFTVDFAGVGGRVKVALIRCG